MQQQHENDDDDENDDSDSFDHDYLPNNESLSLFVENVVVYVAG